MVVTLVCGYEFTNRDGVEAALAFDFWKTDD
jgi:hypothetical protein